MWICSGFKGLTRSLANSLWVSLSLSSACIDNHYVVHTDSYILFYFVLAHGMNYQRRNWLKRMLKYYNTHFLSLSSSPFTLLGMIYDTRAANFGQLMDDFQVINLMVSLYLSLNIHRPLIIVYHLSVFHQSVLQDITYL